MPRKKGSTSKVGIPIKGLSEAIQLVKMVYDRVGDKSMAFQEMAEFMKLPKGISTPIVGAVSEYHLIEKSALGWRISELGKNAIFGDVESVKGAFTKNSLFADLYNRFGDKDITEGIIENYLRSRYKKGKNVELIIKRFFEGLNYIRDIERGSRRLPVEEAKIIQPLQRTEWDKVIQLKYSLNPTKEISKLAEDVAKEFENADDIALTILAKSIKENKNNKEVLTVLVDNLIQLSGKEYIEDWIEEKKQKTSEKKEE